MLVVMVASTVLLVALTLGLKALRAVRQSVREKYYARIEPALERFL